MNEYIVLCIPIGNLLKVFDPKMLFYLVYLWLAKF